MRSVSQIRLQPRPVVELEQREEAERGRRRGFVGSTYQLPAAEADSATGGFNRRDNVFPDITLITRKGIREVTPAELAKLYKKEL